jgi:hypothetical protein
MLAWTVHTCCAVCIIFNFNFTGTLLMATCWQLAAMIVISTYTVLLLLIVVVVVVLHSVIHSSSRWLVTTGQWLLLCRST